MSCDLCWAVGGILGHLCVVFGSIPTRFVDLGVIKKDHTFFNILGIIHDDQGYSLVCCKYHARDILPKGFDGLPLLLGDVVSVPLLVFVVLQNLFGFLEDFFTVLPWVFSPSSSQILLVTAMSSVWVACWIGWWPIFSLWCQVPVYPCRLETFVDCWIFWFDIV